MFKKKPSAPISPTRHKKDMPSAHISQISNTKANISPTTEQSRTQTKIKKKGDYQMANIKELLKNPKNQRIYESIKKADLLEKLEAAHYVCMNCDRGRCCGCEIQKMRQEAYKYGLIEDPCSYCPLANSSCSIPIIEDEEEIIKETIEKPSADYKEPEVSIEINNNIGILTINKKVFKFLISKSSVIKINSNDSNIHNVLKILLSGKNIYISKIYSF
jgi:hypothetical protein